MLLYSIEENVMIDVLSKSTLFLYNANEILYYQNSYPLNLYLILQGEVCFRKYSNFELLTMIGGEENIVISKKYTKIRNSKMNKKDMLKKRNSTLVKGKEDINNKNYLKCGEFFGEDNLINNSLYDNCAITNKNSIILVINRDIFDCFLREKVAKTKDNIRALILHRFTLFRHVERKLLKKYMEKISIIYPKNGEIICKENDLSNKLYLIFQGKCSVQRQSKNLGSILFLNKGDLFGYDSLIQMPEEYHINLKINITKCEYTIESKDDETIILKLDIPFIDELTTWRLKSYLIGYFHAQRKIIQKFERFKNLSTEKLQERYINLDIGKQKNINKKSSYENDIDNNKDTNLIKLSQECKKCFHNAISYEKDILNNKNANKRKVNLISQIFKQFPKNYRLPVKSLQKQNSVDKYDENKNNKSIKLFLNDTTYKTEDKFTTPMKPSTNKNIYTSCTNFKIKEEKKTKKSYSSISTNNISNNNSRSNNLKRFSTYSIKSSLGENTFKNKLINTKYKIIKNNDGNETTKKKIKLKKKVKSTRNIYLTNNEKKCTKFDSDSKLNILDEGLPFVLFHNSKINASYKNYSTSKKIKNQKCSIYNYPIILKEGNSFE